MARKQLVSIDFNNLASQNFKLQNAAGGIASPGSGSAYFDTSAGKPMFHNGTAFMDLTARTNHTGTQLASTISNFDTQVRTSRLDQMAQPTAAVNFNHQNISMGSGNVTTTGSISTYLLNVGSTSQFSVTSIGNLSTSGNISLTSSNNISLSLGTGAITLNSTGGMNANGGKITNLAAPSAANDAARLVDVQSAAAGIDSKASVRVVSTTNVVIATGGLLTIDGVTLVANDRVLLKGQTTASENGVYVVAAGAWSRATDADATGEITPGAFWYVEEGATYGATQWRCGNTGTITLGSTAITIQQFGAASMYTASNGVQLVGSNFSGVVVANSGLSVGASGFAVVNNANKSVELSASGVGVVVDPNGAVVHNGTTGLRVGTSNSNGTGLTANAVVVVHEANGGTQNTAGGVGIKLNTNSGLTLTAGGLAIDSTVAVKKYATTIGDGSLTSIPVTHSLGTKDVTISVRDAATDAAVDCDWTATSTTVTTLTFAVAPASNSLRVVVIG